MTKLYPLKIYRTNMANNYIVTLLAVPEPVLVARIAVLLRKYDITVDSLERQPESDDQERIVLRLRNQRDNFEAAMRKLERLVPVVRLQYQLAKP